MIRSLPRASGHAAQSHTQPPPQTRSTHVTLLLAANAKHLLWAEQKTVRLFQGHVSK